MHWYVARLHPALKKGIIQTLLKTKSERQFLSLSIEENKFE